MPFGRSPLHIAARSGDLEAASTHIKADSSLINNADDHGFTPLYHASLFGHTELMALLIRSGSDITKPDLGGLTPLHIACEKGKPAAAILLLNSGADLRSRDSIGRTPLDWAREKSHQEVLSAVEAWQATVRVASEEELAAHVNALSLTHSSQLSDDAISTIALIVMASDADDRPARAKAADIVAMLRVSTVWRRAIVATDPVWQRLIAVRFPGLSLMHEWEWVATKRRLSYREHFLVQADVERLRGAPQAAVPPRSPTHLRIEDFTFTIEARCVQWQEGICPDVEHQERYPPGSIETWSGVFSHFYGTWRAGQACMGLPGSEDAELLISVYVTPPSLQTWKLYCDGTEDCDEGECMHYDDQPLPYAHSKPVWPGLDFVVGVDAHMDSGVQVRFRFDDDLPDEHVLAYLCGEEIPKEDYEEPR